MDFGPDEGIDAVRQVDGLVGVEFGGRLGEQPIDRLGADPGEVLLDVIALRVDVDQISKS